MAVALAEKPPKAQSPHKINRPRSADLPASRLMVDRQYQRDPDRHQVERMARDMSAVGIDWIALGALIVSDRGNGELAVMDGGGRRQALIISGNGEVPVPCIVHAGLTLQDEAREYVRLNRERLAVTSYDLYRGELVAGDEAVQRINLCLTERGLRAVSQSSTAGDGVRAIATVKEIERFNGIHALRRVLDLTLGAWPKEHALARSREVLDALTAFVVTHANRGEAVDDQVVTATLGKLGVEQFVRHGKQQASREPAYRVMAADLQADYNKAVKAPQRVAELVPSQYTKRPRRPSEPTALHVV